MNKSYIISNLRAPEVTKLYLDKLLKDYTKEDYQFFAHIYNSTLISYLKKESGWVPISSTLIRKKWGKKGVQFQKMVEDEILEIKLIDTIEIADGIFLDQFYSKKDGLSRCFRVPLEVLDNIDYHSPKTVQDFAKCNYYDLMSGKKMNKVIRYRKNDDSNHPFPDLILKAMEIISTCTVNIKALQDHIDLLSLRADSMWGEDKNKEKNRRALIVDRSCFNHIMANIVEVDGDFVNYKVCYKDPQMSGRLTERGSGMQSPSREMKKVGFSGIPNLKNYDLKSSQVYGLIQWFEKANIDTSWLHEYLNQDKLVYANKVGISKDRWKQCFMALIMAAHLQKKVTKKNFEGKKVVKEVKGIEVESIEYVDVAIIRALCEEAEGDADKALDFYLKFCELVAPLKKSIDAWQTWLVDVYIPEASIYPGGKQLVVNKTGMTFDLTDYRSDKGDWINLNALKRKISAFFLQGTEAAYIHHLTIISEHFGFKVISNQHDGIVTIGEIPQEAMDIAQRNSGLKYAILEEKDFV
ncbi:hypothetical protein [Nostoc sp. UHCC 0870]|uniref:hypothetical protein n=1 Tax=Nostoc sp. UHCC 0870 TaxID=2914041 RepID=UPI001EE09614|nr:hypothetical protein [Nostoc sp. UHCC 0870]UKO99380.1 hypothetical protein L6494_06605 [Nostoc sp. UHCC 0870]